MTIAEQAKNGQPFNTFPIIDSHNHLGRWNAFHVPGGGTIEQMVARADRVGIDKMCITAHASIGPDYVYGNNMVYEAILKFPDRVIGYVTMNPNYPEDMQQELERCFSKNGFRAIKLHPSCHGRAVDYHTFDAVYRYADEHQLAVLIHTWGYSDIHAIDLLADRYPNARFIIAHMGGDPQTMEIALDILTRHDNVYGDFAVSTAQEGNVEWMVGQAGSKKLLFGTDMPFYDPCFTLARVAMAHISEEEKQDIFSGNISRLMKL